MAGSLKQAYYRPSHLFERYVRVRRTQDFVGRMSTLFAPVVAIALLLMSPGLWWFHAVLAIAAFTAGMWWVAKEETAQIQLAKRIWAEGEPEERVQLFCLLKASNHRSSARLEAGARSFTEDPTRDFPVLAAKDYTRILIASVFSACQHQRKPVFTEFCITVIKSAPRQSLGFKARQALQLLAKKGRKNGRFAAISEAAQMALAEISEQAKVIADS